MSAFRVYDEIPTLDQEAVLQSLDTPLESNFFYVDILNGSDTNTRSGSGSEMYPFQTITYAISQVTTSPTNIVVRKGTYTNDFKYSENTDISNSINIIFEEGARVIRTDSGSIGFQTTDANAVVNIYGKGYFNSNNAYAMRHTGDGILNIMGAEEITSSSGEPTIQGAVTIQNVDLISNFGSTPAEATSSCVVFVDRGGALEYTIRNIGKIIANGTDIKCNIGDTIVSPDYKLTIENIDYIITLNENLECCLETNTPTGTGSGNTVNIILNNCKLFSNSYVGGPLNNQRTIAIQNQYNCFVTNCVFKSNSLCVYTFAGTITYLYNCILIALTPTIIQGGGSFGWTASSSNVGVTGGVEDATEIFAGANTTDANIDYLDVNT